MIGIFKVNVCGLQRLQPLQSLQRLQSLQSLQSLQRLQSLQPLQRLQSLQPLQRLQLFWASRAAFSLPKYSVFQVFPFSS